jgi:glycosyltransferase A (GT-A) superfamily protein (DUF2064 family)
MAKAPVPGRVKTRLMPTFTATDAAAIAHAALADTLHAVRACAADKRVVAMAGVPVPRELCHDVEVIAQRGASFNERLTAAWAYAGTPGVQIGMDTPHVTAELLDEALSQLVDGPDDAVLGMAVDGGWWAIGFRRPVPAAFVGVPTSNDDTGARQLEHLRRLGVSVGMLPELCDMDRPEDVAAIAAAYPHLNTARVAAQTLAAS